MTTKLKNAGLKTIQEAMHRLIDGEVLYITDNDTIRVDPEGFSSMLESPNTTPLSDVQTWQVKKEWWETLKDGPILCWLNSVDSRRKEIAAYISLVRSDGQYLSDTGTVWRFATPVNPEECYND